MTAANNTRHMQTPGSTTAGGAASALGSSRPTREPPGAGVPPLHDLQIDGGHAEPHQHDRRREQRNPAELDQRQQGALAWPNATDPQGNPPNGKIDFNHSWAAHTTANQSGQPGSRRTTIANRPNSAGNSADTVASTIQGIAPTSMLIQGSSGR